MANTSTQRPRPPKIKHKETAALAATAYEQGWLVVSRKKGHVMFQSPQGSKVFTSATPSDHRVGKNLRSQLRRAGLVA